MRRPPASIETQPVPDPRLALRTLGAHGALRAALPVRVWAHPRGFPWLGEVLELVARPAGVALPPAWPHAALAFERGLLVSAAPLGEWRTRHLGTEAGPNSVQVLSHEARLGLAGAPRPTLRALLGERALQPGCLQPGDLDAILLDVQRREGVEAALALAAELEALGLDEAHRAGLSLCLDDFELPHVRDSVVARARSTMHEVNRRHASGLMTDGERMEATVRAWVEASDRVLVADDQPRASSYLRENESLARALHGGLAWVHEPTLHRFGCAQLLGEGHELVIEHSLAEGLEAHEQLLLARAARRGAWTDARRHDELGALFEDLTELLGEVRIVEACCDDGAAPSPTVPGAPPDPDRRRPGTDLRGKLTVTAGQDDRSGANLRSPLTCGALGGVCARCYGVDPATLAPVALGRPVGRLAGRVICSWAMDLTLEDSFHICGPESRADAEPWPSEQRGQGGRPRVAFRPDLDPDHPYVVLETCSLRMSDDFGSASCVVPRGARVATAEGQSPVYDRITAWRTPRSREVLLVDLAPDAKARVELVDVREVVDIDPVTGLALSTAIPQDGPAARPRIVLHPMSGHGDTGRIELALAWHMMLSVKEGDVVQAGDELAFGWYMPHRSLARLIDLVRLRRAATTGPAAPLSGVATYSADGRVLVEGDDGERRELTLLWSRGMARRRVRKGDGLDDHCRDHHEMLRELGPAFMQRHLLDELEELFPKAHGAHLALLARAIVARTSGGRAPSSRAARWQRVWQTQLTRLRAGHPVWLRATGESMRGILEPGDWVEVEPLGAERSLAVGDVVLCTVAGELRLHGVHAIEGDRLLIGSHRGAPDGWIDRSAVHGYVGRVAGR